MNRKKEVYIAGPMSGYPEFNFPAFFAAQNKLEMWGWKVWNPAAKETEKEVQANAAYIAGDNKALVESGWDYKGAITWDCMKVIWGDGIYMLKGWEFSIGAIAEHSVAKFIKAQRPDYEIMYEH